MKKFNRNSSTSRGPKNNFNKFAKKDSSTFEKSKPRKFQSDTQLHEAICESCGKTCGVPFKPNGKKPVYCTLCFKKGNHSESKNDYQKNEFRTSGFSKPESYKKEFEELHKKLDTILKLLEGK